MPSVVLVHGTGVREPGYNQMLGLVRSRLHVARESYTLCNCRWYIDHGTPPPPYESSPAPDKNYRAVGAVPISDEILSWQALYIDPLIELRELANAAIIGGRPDAAASFAKKIHACPRPDSMKDTAPCSVCAFWNESVQTILGDEDAKKAISRGSAKPDETRSTVARAIVAELIRRGIEAGAPLPDKEQRDAWVDDLRHSLGADPAVTFRAIPKILTPASRFLNRYLFRPVGETHAPVAADILFYQARGQGIRDCISKTIAEAPGPVYVMAHSLGGIAALDTLIQNPNPKVAAIVTFGSQAPFLYEINAMVSLEKGHPLPENFPKTWCNVFDPNDLLSFRAQKLFPGDIRVQDEELNSGQPPLAAHSSYLTSNAFWKIVWKILPHGPTK